MDVLVFCEYSDVVGAAFRAAGHNVTSSDLLPSEGSPNHYQGDGRHLLQRRWDIVIAHPPCTFLCNSGVRWLHERPGRWLEMWKAAAFFRECLEANAPRIAVENPVMHHHAVLMVGRKHDFTVQPWQFGDATKKRTCWWTKGLPVLEPTETHPAPTDWVYRMPPGAMRGHERGRFHPGMARAMAQQWGRF